VSAFLIGFVREERSRREMQQPLPGRLEFGSGAAQSLSNAAEPSDTCG